MLSLAHIINPVTVQPSSDLYLAQPITFQTMQEARNFSKNNLNIQLFSAHFPEDNLMSPKHFTQTPLLNRSVLDKGNFTHKRKLPLIKDILDRLYELSKADFFIYTNVDIALQPFFYTCIAQLIYKGFDSFVINRRTISKTNTNLDSIPLMQAENGTSHPGYDCFVFKRDFYPHFTLGNSCIGADAIGKIMLTNLILHSKKFSIFKELHLTFHLGDDRSWKNPLFNEYDKHNKKELVTILETHKNTTKISDPIIQRFIYEIKKENASLPELLKLKAKNFLTRIIHE